MEALNQIIADKNSNNLFHIRHGFIWKPYKNKRHNYGWNAHNGNPWAEFSHFQFETVYYVGSGNCNSKSDEGGSNAHILQIHGFDSDGVSHKKACGGKCNHSEKIDCKLNTHTAHAVRNRFFIRNIFPERRCFPVGADI